MRRIKSASVRGLGVLASPRRIEVDSHLQLMGWFFFSGWRILLDCSNELRQIHRVVVGLLLQTDIACQFCSKGASTTRRESSWVSLLVCSECLHNP